MQLSFSVAVACALAFAAGCQSAFERDSAYGTAKPVTQKSFAQKTAFSDLSIPMPGRGDVKAEFSCDVERPSDPALSGYVDACLAEAYRHARGEERADVAAKGAKGLRDAFFADHREWFDENWAEAAAAMPEGQMVHGFEWTCQVEGRVTHCDARHFSYRVTIDAYCGGAHGNRWVQNATYSRLTGRRLTAADVIRPEDMTDVVNLIRKALLAETREDEHLHAQLEETIVQPYGEYVRDIRSRKRDEWGNPLVTENFMLTKDGVVWTYNQYEIACYASGWFDALVTWDALRRHLRRAEAERR